jgi:hypothetical protein
MMATTKWQKDPKNQETIKKSRREYYYRNKEAEKERIANRKKDIREWYVELKSTLSCEQCGQNHPATLQFHHLNPNEKEIGLGSVVSQGWSKERIKSEIDKCMVLCANCHFIHHWDERN